jgi:AraC-like DNA-binding protein/quercetin dioxygenase-like cupin family protein
MQVSFDLYKHEIIERPVVAVEITMAENVEEIPPHRHPSGQLILALHGAVTCELPKALWMVPPNCAVWIPGNVEHRCLATVNARICFLLIKAEVAGRFARECCTLAITPMVREMILHLAANSDRPADDHLSRTIEVLLGELERAPATTFQLPLPTHPKLRPITDALTADPSERSTLTQWSRRLAMNERTLSRLIIKETGTTFGRWRQQLHLLVALRLLASGHSVQHVSGSLGYASVTAFITMFKKALGVTPSQYFDDAPEGSQRPTRQLHLDER